MAKEKKEKEDTPLIKQYYKFKAACPEALLLMRVGDFYETYGEDAVKASKVELYAETGPGRLQGGRL